MVGKASQVVSFVALLSAWVVGLAVALLFGWKIPLLTFDLSTPLGLFWLGLVVLVFCMMFFGRLGFLLFFSLGAIQAFEFSYPFFLLFFFRGLVLSWFGMIGVLIGEMLFEDLNNHRDFNLADKRLIALLILGVLLAFFVAFFSTALYKAGNKIYEIAHKIRNREFSFGNILDFFRPVDQNQNRAPNPSDLNTLTAT